jgi:lipid A 3-O-deacylase
VKNSCVEITILKICILLSCAAGYTSVLYAQEKSGNATSDALPIAYPNVHPAEQWEVAFEAGYATKIKHNSPWNYAIAPAQIAFRSPYAFDLWRGDSGARLAVRNRMSLIGETFVRGPEDYYIGFSGAPSIELWSADQKMAVFYEIGGGAGLTNAKGVVGGQGQNFAFNWYTQLGARFQINKKLAITGSRYFMHHSNRGMTNPNPGIDVLGYNVGLVWQLGK